MNYKLLNDIDKLNNFGEIELNERVYIFKVFSITLNDI